MNTKEIKKGDKIFAIRSWNKTTAYYAPLTVYSSGKQQFILVDDQGSKFENTSFCHSSFHGEIYPRNINTNIKKIALKFAEKIRDAEIKNLEKCLLNDNCDSYKAAIQEKLDGIKKSPARAITHKQGIEEIRQQVS